MTRSGLAASLVVVAATLAVAPAVGARSRATVDARLEVRVEPATATTRVEGRLRWTNDSGEPVAALCLVFDGGPTWDGGTTTDPELEDLRIARGAVGPLAVSSPDHGVVRVVLDQPVAPAASAELDVSWNGRAAAVGRGRDGGPWALAGTLPRLVVPAGPGAGCADGAAAERGRVRLLLDVPTGWRVAATGSDVGGQRRDGSDGARDRAVWSVDGVDHVGWLVVDGDDSVVVEGGFDPLEIASDRVVEAADRLGLAPVELQLPPVHVRVVTRPDLAPRGRSLLEEVRTALAWFGLAYGGYPWPQLDVVLVEDPDGALLRLAPTLVVVAVPAAAWPLDPTGEDELRRRAAAVLAAETFRSVVAFEASAPAWLAPGVERYATTSYRAWRHERSGRRIGAIGSPWTRCRLELAAADGRRPPTMPGDGELLTALALRSLDRGPVAHVAARGLRRVVDAGRLGATSYGALRDALSRAAGQDVGALLDEVVIERRAPDWRVRHVASSATARPDGSHLTTVELERSHTAAAPVEVLVRLADGGEERRRWDGGEAAVRWTLVTTAPVVAVGIDPEVAWPVEVRRADNGWQAPAPWWRQPRPPWLAPGLHLIGLVAWPWS